MGAVVIWLSLLINLPMLCSSYSHQSSHSPCHHFVIILRVKLVGKGNYCIDVEVEGGLNLDIECTVGIVES